MLTRKKIALLNGADDLTPVISQSVLTFQQQGENILRQAQQQAEQILAAAEEAAEACKLRAQARAEEDFWHQADILLAHWQHQQRQSESEILVIMDSVLTLALKQLLTEIPETQRLNALLRQLLRDKMQAEQASLCCHPSQQQPIGDWLATHTHLNWQLQPDETLAVDDLKLVTAQGELHLDWQQAVRQLLPPESVSSSL
ncbi:type III secretion system stator protein SctL [Pantoea agglomerans]|uniref:Type III secretion system stator protein SctL n=1 Tax=Enterobacter agglomerans TaxID=549 RepID=A0AAN2K8D7_ENTAG|nr:type III secretion system stator protein SctL [Pantoea agglomerans]CAH6373991.1 type III secretion system stator protein SctL [Pantoea agglomerans]